MYEFLGIFCLDTSKLHFPYTLMSVLPLMFFFKFDNRDKCIVAFCLMIYFPMIIEKIFPIPSYLYNSKY